MKINRYLDFNDMFRYKNTIVRNDMEEMLRVNLPWDKLGGKSCLVTGANGMIATYMVYLLMSLVRDKGMDIRVVALSRDRKRAEELFADFLEDPHFELLIQDVCESIHREGGMDYIFHFAGNASPYYIQNDPVGIMKSNLLGTINVLELAREKETEKVLFASTREVYGDNAGKASLAESSFGRLDCLDARSCYPESKRAAETLCKSYYLQYGIDFNSVRIAHTYGPGMRLENDGRVMADLLNFVIQNKNIVLRSKGEALRAFCYITDTLLGLMFVLLYGEEASAYNLANETEETSVRSLAETLIGMSPDKGLRIDYDIPENQSVVYCDYIRVALDTSRLEALGWKPCVSLEKGMKRVLGIYP